MSATCQSITCSCRKANVFRSDYVADGVQFINRHCIGCGNHWHGTAGNVTAYSRAEWDRSMDDALAAERAETRAYAATQEAA